MEDNNLLTPGWYLARDGESKWWNLFVYVTKEAPYKCIQIVNGEISYTTISPEKIAEVSHKRISLGEFKIIQELQKLNISSNFKPATSHK